MISYEYENNNYCIFIVAQRQLPSQTKMTKRSDNKKLSSTDERSA